ncbi:unnamed protein product, partial [Tenebrio molitor]
FLIVDHLTEILKSGVPDSQIIADMQLKRTKCTNIVKNVLGTHATNCLVNEFMNTKTKGKLRLKKGIFKIRVGKFYDSHLATLQMAPLHHYP